MVVGRAARRASRKAAVTESFGPVKAEAALDLLELVEFAWHDCYAEINPPDAVVEDILVVAGGDLSRLIQVARRAVEDFRDVRLHADAIRAEAAERP